MRCFVLEGKVEALSDAFLALKGRHAELKVSISEFINDMPAALSAEIETRMQHRHVMDGLPGDEVTTGPAIPLAR